MDPAIDLPALGHEIARSIRARLEHQLRDYGLGETLGDPSNLKSTHAIDDYAADLAAAALAAYRCNIFIEGRAHRFDPYAPVSFYIDPVDGSTNWERCVGDPAFVIACCPQPVARTLGDLDAAYVEGLASGDRYWACHGEAIYQCARTGQIGRLGPAPPVSLSHATGYLRFGYGGARQQLAHSVPLMFACRDIRAFDNAGTEFCHVARGAAHFILESRGFSDGFNLLAYPVLRTTGGVLLDLEGNSLECRRWDPTEHYDYIAASSPALADEVVSFIDEARTNPTYRID